MVLVDISMNPGSSIGEITARTGFPQSHVSASVARLRQQGVLETSIDAVDARLGPWSAWVESFRERLATRAPVPIDAALAAELASPDRQDLAQAISTRLKRSPSGSSHGALRRTWDQGGRCDRGGLNLRAALSSG